MVTPDAAPREPALPSPATGRGENQGVAADGLPLFYAPDQQAWRAWLDEHHATARRVARLLQEGQKNILWWISSAKRPETRAKRMAETVRLAADYRLLGNN